MRKMIPQRTQACRAEDGAKRERIGHPEMAKPLQSRGFVGVSSLTMSYFHTGIRTIIGAESFHCPVRDGKEWDQLAMVIRLKLFTAQGLAWCSSFAESNSYLDCVVAEGSLLWKRSPIGSRGWRSCTASQS